MIQGLKVTVATAELASLCKTRAAYHHLRAKDYEASLAALESLNVPNTSNRPGDDAKHNIDTHRSQAAELQFIAEHLQPGELFLLDVNDLSKLGIAYRGY